MPNNAFEIVLGLIFVGACIIFLALFTKVFAWLDHSKGDTRANSDTEVRDLCHQLSERREEIRSGRIEPIDVAREMTGETPDDDPRAQALLHQAYDYAYIWQDDGD
jgi:hypothetical protein